MITTSEVILMYNYRCDICGAYLDPGESCDCRGRRREQQEAVAEMLTADKDGQMVLREAIENGTYTRV